MAERVIPNGYCFCGCGGETKVVNFLPGHDKKAEAAVLELHYGGTVLGLLQHHNYGPQGVNLQDALRKHRGTKENRS